VNDSAAPEETLRVTDRQLELLRAVRGWILEHQRMPSVRELARTLSRSPSTVQQHLRALERRGYIRRDGSAHGLTLLVSDKALGLTGGGGAGLPIKGSLRPGQNLIREQAPYPRIRIGGTWETGDYVLRIDGDALAPEGIFKDDLLVIRPGGSGGESPLLIEFSNGIATVKRILKGRGGHPALAPATPRIDRRRGRRPPLALTVLGRVVEVIRRFDE
jgi:repressor LexA